MSTKRGTCFFVKNGNITWNLQLWQYRFQIASWFSTWQNCTLHWFNSHWSKDFGADSYIIADCICANCFGESNKGDESRVKHIVVVFEMIRRNAVRCVVNRHSVWFALSKLVLKMHTSESVFKMWYICICAFIYRSLYMHLYVHIMYRYIVASFVVTLWNSGSWLTSNTVRISHSKKAIIDQCLMR